MQNSTRNPTRNTASTSHFLTINGVNIDFTEKNAWFKQCRKKALPLVTILVGKKVAEVECDFITLPDTLIDLLESKQAVMMVKYRDLRDTFGNKKTELWGGGLTALFRNVPNAQAEELAEALFDLATEKLGLVH